MTTKAKNVPIPEPALTPRQIRKHACRDGYREMRQTLREKHGKWGYDTPITLSTALELFDFYDVLMMLEHYDDLRFVRLFAADCLEHIEPHFRAAAPSYRHFLLPEAIEEIRRYVRGGRTNTPGRWNDALAYWRPVMMRVANSSDLDGKMTARRALEAAYELYETEGSVILQSVNNCRSVAALAARNGAEEGITLDWGPSDQAQVDEFDWQRKRLGELAEMAAKGEL